MVALRRGVLAVDNSKIGAVYKGLAFGHTSQGNFIYATNFHDGSVEMYDTNFQLVKTFTDIGLPPGYAPFGVQSIRGRLYVTFAKQDADKHEMYRELVTASSMSSHFRATCCSAWYPGIA
jgi:uncharacterized protein (TIGR03118 family)